MKFKKKLRRIFRRDKLIKGSKGVISLFLCLVMMPMLTGTSALIEFYRHQAAVETTRELADAATLSSLADYDEYLQDRFGLFAVSQDHDISTEFSENFTKNSAILGGTLNESTSASATGTTPLSDHTTLKNQLLDFSENTVLTEILLEDLNLMDLIDKLSALTDIDGTLNKMMDSAEKIKNLTSAIDTLITAGETLIEKIENLDDDIQAIKDAKDELAESIATLYQDAKENIENFDSQSDESLKELVEKYSSEIKDIYTDVETLKGTLNTLSNNIDGVITAFNDVKTGLSEAKTALAASNSASEEVKNTVEDTQSDADMSKVSESSNSLMGTIIKHIDDAVKTATESLKDSTINNIKTVATDFIEHIKSELGLDLRTYSADYYKITDGKLSDAATEDLKKLLKNLPDVWEEGSFESITNQLKEMFLPDSFDVNFLDTLKATMKQAVDKAKSEFEIKMKESVAEILSALVSAISALFDLDIFYDGSLCANVNATVPESPYQDFLEALQTMIGPVNTFTSSESGFFEKLRAVGTLFTSVKKTLEATMNLISTTVSQIGTLVSYISDPGKLYEVLLLAGYMTHNLPNRTLAGASVVNKDLSGYNKKLTESALTGYSYSDIPIPVIEGQTGLASGIGGLAKFFEDTVAEGGGSDPMFMGAELEFILAGTSSELMNQTIVFMQLYFLRLILDIPSIFTDSAVNTMAASATVVSWVVYLIVILAEPLCDTIFLVNGESAPLFKGSCYLSPVGIPELIKKLAGVAISNATVRDSVTNKLESSVENKLSNWKENNNFDSTPKEGSFDMYYDTHCLLLILMTTNETQILNRFSTLIELEAGYYYSLNGASYTFDIEKAYASVTTKANVKYNSFFSVFEFDSSTPLSQKFEFTRGY